MLKTTWKDNEKFCKWLCGVYECAQKFYFMFHIPKCVFQDILIAAIP